MTPKETHEQAREAVELLRGPWLCSGAMREAPLTLLCYIAQQKRREKEVKDAGK